MNTQSNSSSNRSELIKTLAIIIITGIGLPVSGSLLIGIHDPQWIVIHEPIHSIVEISGCFIAIMVATVLLFFIKDDVCPKRHYFAYALIAMGLLDGLHAAVSPGILFVWLHSVATFIGGGLFFLVWTNKFEHQSPKHWWIAIPVLLFGILSIIFQQQLPAMITDGQFTPIARMLNIGGGLFFYLAVIKLIHHYLLSKDKTYLIFAIHCSLFGTAGFLFELSSIWDGAWWWWHFLRFVAYLILGEFVYIIYQKTSKAYLKKLIDERRRAEEANLASMMAQDWV